MDLLKSFSLWGKKKKNSNKGSRKKGQVNRKIAREKKKEKREKYIKNMKPLGLHCSALACTG